MIIILLTHTVPYILVFFLIESPFYHYKNRDVSSIFKCLVQICQINFSKEDIPHKILQIRNSLKYGNAQKKSDSVKNNDITNEEIFIENKKKNFSKLPKEILIIDGIISEKIEKSINSSKKKYFINYL